MAEGPDPHATRRRIYDAIVAHPGLSGADVRRLTGTDWGEASEQLRRLEEAGHVVRAAGESGEFYFARAVPDPPAAILSQARSPVPRRVVIALLEEPGLTLDGIVRRTGLRRPQVAQALRPLVETGLVRPVGQGEDLGYAAGDPVGIGQLVARSRYGMFDRWIDGAASAGAEIFPP